MVERDDIAGGGSRRGLAEDLRQSRTGRTELLDGPAGPDVPAQPHDLRGYTLRHPQGWLGALSAGARSVLTGGEAAVHGERGAVDEAAFVTEEESGERGDVLL